MLRDSTIKHKQQANHNHAAIPHLIRSAALTSFSSAIMERIAMK